ncbi:anthranilate phosphoribosyltransferase [Mesohalobacter halotolerans]|uniref:Anthranilate phosphoribosyltransferase n=1 Tax=Mesohalobacter halotolerans TaxID=1883405 RepID=A0A4U5TNX2_9FLAO|nr:anthranilate phosphoribosyltransferase [Mesohalobacter halotolerans]MBS3739301.1 anthranilate phosphoribosyltransferase [Psychroflexus sp.]TKS55522.1 anthranilate phosphoribosyltransferase [Mesohalobacter halotolerans]
MKTILNRLIAHETLSKDEAKQILKQISTEDFSEVQIAAFLTVFMMRNITLDELTGFRQALLELCHALDFSEFDPIDLCGTGGDSKNTFNISTLAAFVTAGAGVHVAKHGNYGVSSVSGSSNVLVLLGLKFQQEESIHKHCLDKANICILHAPLFHPAMKTVAPVRKSLALKTFFNMLGPMVNPCQPQKQLVGVYSLQLLRLYSYLYQKNHKAYAIVHALDGYDEISLTQSAKVVTHQEDRVLEPEDFGLKRHSPEAIFGGNSVREAADIFMNVLQNKSTPEQQHVVCANAALAISVSKDIDLKTAFAEARESLKSGRALKSFNRLIELSQSI